VPAPIRRGADYRTDRGFDGAADRQSGGGNLPSGRDPGQELGPEADLRKGRGVQEAGPGQQAAGRLQVKNAEHDLACYLAPHLGGTRPDGSPRILITSSWVIDSRWITRQWIPGLGRRIVMTCSCSLEPDM
jgi:hypothetical protein